LKKKQQFDVYPTPKPKIIKGYSAYKEQQEKIKEKAVRGGGETG
jgi:hypothetical protein